MRTILEMMYAMGIMLSVIGVEVLTLHKLKTASDEKVERVLKLQSHPLVIAGMFAWAFLLVFFLPRWLGFKLNFPGFYMGMALYMGYAYKVGKPTWQGLKDRVREKRMKELGQQGARMADLKVRKMSDFLPVWVLAIPYAVLLVGLAYLLVRQGTAFLLSGTGAFAGMVFLLCVGMNGFLTKWMFKIVQEPVDLRSDRPERFAAKMNSFLRGRLRLLLVFQIAYCLSTIALVLGFAVVSPAESRSILNPNWIVFGSLPFLACGVWIAISSTRGMARLEAERWNSTSEPPV